MSGQMAGLGGSYTASRAAAEPDQNALYRPQGTLNPNQAATQATQAQAPRMGLGGSASNNYAPTNSNYSNVHQAPAGMKPDANAINALMGGGMADDGGVAAGYDPRMQAGQVNPQAGPSLAEIQAEMQRRQVGQQLNANPANSALAGYMMG